MNAEYLIDSAACTRLAAEKFLPKEVGDEFMTVAEQLTEKGREEGMEKGIEKGREEGREESKRQTALNLLKNGVSIEIISRSTGLSKEEIESLRD